MPLDPAAESAYYASRAFDPANTTAVRGHYVQYVEGRDFLVDLGCGRGEFLQLSQPVVGRVRGVDVDPEMVRLASRSGIDVVHTDVLDYLTTTDDRPDAVFAAHIVEHLSVDTTFDFLRSIGAVLQDGGVLIVVTPNPACLAMLTAEFWSDPTHVRPYTLDLLEFLFGAAGFEVTYRGGNPADMPGPPPELLASHPLPPWGNLVDELTGWNQTSRWASRDVEELAHQMSQLRHAIGALDDRLTSMRHFATHIADRLNDTLHFLYPANEIYVVGRKTS